MSIDKIAKLLQVDEVKLMHGPRGYAVHVRVDKSWNSDTIDHHEFGGDADKRLRVVAKRLTRLADAHNGLRKSMVDAMSSASMYADVAADEVRRQRYLQSMRDAADARAAVGYQEEAGEYASPDPVVSAAPPAPALSDPMPSRYHAVLAELKTL